MENELAALEKELLLEKLAGVRVGEASLSPHGMVGLGEGGSEGVGESVGSGLRMGSGARVESSPRRGVTPHRGVVGVETQALRRYEDTQEELEALERELNA